MAEQKSQKGANDIVMQSVWHFVSTGIPEYKLNEIKKIVEKYADNFKEQFRQHIGKRIND